VVFPSDWVICLSNPAQRALSSLGVSSIERLLLSQRMEPLDPRLIWNSPTTTVSIRSQIHRIRAEQA